MLKQFFVNHKVDIMVAIILLVVWLNPDLFDFLGFQNANMNQMKVYFPIIMIIFTIFLLGVSRTTMSKMSKTKAVFNYISEYRLPAELKEILIQKISDFNVPKCNILDLLPMVSGNQTLNSEIGSNLYRERSFSLYDAEESWSQVFTTNTYFIIKNNSILLLTMGSLFHYSITSVQEGYLETFFSNKKLTVCLNDSVLGHFDYSTKEFYDTKGDKKGSFDVPDHIVVSVSSTGYGLNRNSPLALNTGSYTSVYSDGAKIADINLLASSAKRIKNNNSIRLFENLNVSSDWEAYMLLGFAIAEYAVIRTRFGAPRRNSRVRRNF